MNLVQKSVKTWSSITSYSFLAKRSLCVQLPITDNAVLLSLLNLLASSLFISAYTSKYMALNLVSGKSCSALRLLVVTASPPQPNIASSNSNPLSLTRFSISWTNSLAYFTILSASSSSASF